jgi:hypothetical protein
MNAVVKGMWCDAIDMSLEEYRPENPECFGLWVNLRIGPDGVDGAHDYQLLVCTPGWLEVTLRYEWGGANWGRHMLIVLEYDSEIIKKKIISYVESCTGKDFWEMAQKVARIASWEFEDYQPQTLPPLALGK